MGVFNPFVPPSKIGVPPVPTLTPEEQAANEAEAEAEADLQLAKAKAIAKARKLPAGQSPYHPIQEMGITTGERQVIKGLPGSMEAKRKWLEQKGEAEALGVGIPRAEKPKAIYDPLVNFFNVSGTPTGQYDTVEYKPGHIAVRPKGTNQPWKVVDPDTGFFSRDFVQDVYSDLVPEFLAFGAKSPATIPGAVASATTAQAGLEGVSSLYGVERTPKEVVENMGIAGVAGGVAKPLGDTAAKIVGRGAQGVGSVLQKPQAFVDKISGEKAREEIKILKQLIQAEKGKLTTEVTRPAEAALATAQADRRLILERLEKQLAEREAQAAKEFGEYIPPATTKEVASAPSQEAIKGTFEAAQKALSEPAKKTITFITDVAHPAWGVKAANLKYLPEFKAILKKWWGKEILPTLGTEGMTYRDKYLLQKALELPQEELDRRALGMAQDIGKWMMSEERISALNMAERGIVEKVIGGAASRAEQNSFRNIISKVAKTAIPEELKVAQQNVTKASTGMAMAKAAKKNTEASIWEPRMQEIRETTAALPERMTLGPLGLLTKTPALAGKITQGLGNWMVGKDPYTLAAMAQTSAPAAVRKEIDKAIKAWNRGHKSYQVAIITILNNPGVRAWAEERFKEENTKETSRAK